MKYTDRLKRIRRPKVKGDMLTPLAKARLTILAYDQVIRASRDDMEYLRASLFRLANGLAMAIDAIDNLPKPKKEE